MRTTTEGARDSEENGRPAAWDRINRFEAWLFQSRQGALFCALAFLVFTATRGLAYLNDEGVLPFEYLQGTNREFWAFFFQTKSKPVIQVLYVLPAGLGLQAWLIAHSVVGTAAVFMMTEAARRLAIPRPNLAGWLVATSTIFAVSAANGIPNADGLAFFALFIWLYASGRWSAAGVVLGMLPLVRHELGVVLIVFVIWDLFRRRRPSFLLPVFAVPVLYVLAGAIYHGNLLWVLDLWVNPTVLPDEIKTWSALSFTQMLEYQSTSFVNNSPILSAWAVIGAILMIRRRASRLFVFLIVALASFAAIVWMQSGLGQAMDQSLRGYLLMVPPIALLSAWGLSWPIVPVGHADPIPEGGCFPFWSAQLATVLRLLLVAGAIAWQAWLMQDPRDVVKDQHSSTHQLIAELKERGIYTGQPLFTDRQTARYDECAGIATERTWLLANEHMLWEIRRNTTVDSGQREATMRAFADARFLFEPDRHEIRRDALYLLARHPRVDAWRRLVEAAGPHHEVVGKYDAYTWPQEERL